MTLRIIVVLLTGKQFDRNNVDTVEFWPYHPYNPWPVWRVRWKFQSDRPQHCSEPSWCCQDSCWEPPPPPRTGPAAPSCLSGPPCRARPHSEAGRQSLQNLLNGFNTYIYIFLPMLPRWETSNPLLVRSGSHWCSDSSFTLIPFSNSNFFFLLGQ